MTALLLKAVAIPPYYYPDRLTYRWPPTTTTLTPTATTAIATATATATATAATTATTAATTTPSAGATMRQYPPRRKKPPRVVGCHARLSRLPGLAFFGGRRCCLGLSGYLAVAPRLITQLVQFKMDECGARPGYQVVSNIWLDEAWAVDNEKRRLMITARGWLSLVVPVWCRSNILALFRAPILTIGNRVTL